MNVIRHSQIIGLMTMDGSTATKYDRVEEVWLDERGRVVYLAGSQGYTPLEQVSIIGPDAVLTYSSSVLMQSLYAERLSVGVLKDNRFAYSEFGFFYERIRDSNTWKLENY